MTAIGVKGLMFRLISVS